MGMNYYAITKYGDTYHIGKSSSGWEFHFEAHPGLDVYSSTQWLSRLKSKGWRIENEDGETVTFEFFENLIDPAERAKRHVTHVTGKLMNHFDYVQQDEYENLIQLHIDYNQSFSLVLDDVQPRNCWKDSAGFAVSLGEFS